MREAGPGTCCDQLELWPDLRLSLRRQTGRVTTRKLKSREGFQVRQFAKEHNLGECAAGLFFWSSSDEE